MRGPQGEPAPLRPYSSVRCSFRALICDLSGLGTAPACSATCSRQRSCPAGHTLQAGRLSVTGSASVAETPDTAKVHLSVTVNKPTAAEARDEAAATASAVIGALGGVQGINGDDDVSTENLNLQPNYVWVQETRYLFSCQARPAST